MHKHATSNSSITRYLLQELLKITDDAWLIIVQRRVLLKNFYWKCTSTERIHNGPISAQN